MTREIDEFARGNLAALPTLPPSRTQATQLRTQHLTAHLTAEQVATLTGEQIATLTGSAGVQAYHTEHPTVPADACTSLCSGDHHCHFAD